jgi:hypothetical protein
MIEASSADGCFDLTGSPLHIGSAPYSLAVDTRGLRVYVGSDFGTMSVFSVAAGTGALDSLGPAVQGGGPQPEIAFIQP